MSTLERAGRNVAALTLAFVAFAAASPSCQPAFTTEIPARSLSIAIVNEKNVAGSADTRLPISFSAPQSFHVNVQALDENGVPAPEFNGFVRFSIQPGSVVSASGNPNTNGRNVQLIGGVANDVTVSVVGAYGDARIWVEDLGYTPGDPAGAIPPQCANGIDDNHNGLVDYPVDPGCYAANDDSENGGSYAGAASDTIYFVYPRIADVRGIINGGAGTPFPNEQVQVDTEWKGTTTNTPKGVVVVGLGASGFFVTDIGETRGYASVYGYTYSAPALMYVCDRLIDFGGTSADFYGFTEMNYPTWSLDEWDPTERPCLVPEPTTIDANAIGQGTAALATLEAGLVQLPQVGCSGLAHCCGGGCSGLSTCCAQLPGAEQTACRAVVEQQSFGACTSSLVAYEATGCAGLSACCAAVPTGERAACEAAANTPNNDTACTQSLNQYISNKICGTCASDGTAKFSASALHANDDGKVCTEGSECESGFCTHVATANDGGASDGGAADGGKTGRCTAPVATCTEVVAGDDPATCQGSLLQAQAAGYCGSTTVHVSQNFGPHLVPHTLSGTTCTIPAGSAGIGPDTTNCDYLGTGTLDFTDPCEAACSAACTANLECTEYSNFVAQQQFTLVLVDHVTNTKTNIFGNGSASASFDPISLAHAGTNLGSFSGNLMYFSGGSQFTVTARCADDVVTDPNQLPLPSSQACVVSRAIPDQAAAH